LFTNSKTKAAILAISREKNRLALKDIWLAPDFCNSNSQKIAIIQGIKLIKMLARDPYRYRYIPEIIDNYPSDIEVNPGYAMVNNS